jgi:hypothetical protein
MNECFVNYPKIPTMGNSILEAGTKRIQTRIEDGHALIIRFHHEGWREDKVYHLPQKPPQCPNWEYAITLPGAVENERGLVFVLGNYWCFWSLEKETNKPWIKSDAIPNSNFLMSALETDPSPFDKFCRELLRAQELAIKKSGTPLPSNRWPKDFHTHWFDILMQTTCTCQMNPDKTNNTIQRRLGMDEKTTKTLIENLRIGAIVSMAQRSSNELTAAAEIIKEKTGKIPKDNKWMSLLELVKIEE